LARSSLSIQSHRLERGALSSTYLQSARAHPAPAVVRSPRNSPGMRMVMPHNHRMWAVIGIYTGREDNVFWRRLKGTPNKIEAAGAKALCEMDAEPLGTDIIHSVINPINKLTGAIHIYGGDFFAVERSEWDSLSPTRTSVRRRTGEAAASTPPPRCVSVRCRTPFAPTPLE